MRNLRIAYAGHFSLALTKPRKIPDQRSMTSKNKKTKTSVEKLLAPSRVFQFPLIVEKKLMKKNYG